MLRGWCGKMNKDFWRGKRVLITGNTGFKGSWLSRILLDTGAEVFGYALENDDEYGVFNAIGLDKEMSCRYGDICDEGKVSEAIKGSDPEIVFHLAAQPIVLKGYEDPVYTYRTNVMGTVTLLNALRDRSGLRSVVNVTTDKVYENNDNGVSFRESDRLGGYDPYSGSKACSELVTSTFVSSFFNPVQYGISHNAAVATARAGNVIGGGDNAPDRIIPDCIRAVRNGEAVKLRNPYSIRPWQHVLEPLALYIMLAEKLYENGTEYSGAYNVGPREEDCLTVIDVVKKLGQNLPSLVYELPENAPETDLHEAKKLILDTGKISEKLGFVNKWGIDECIGNTALWYRAQLDGEDMVKVTDKMIKEYFEI